MVSPTNGEDFEIANYLFYTINDCWKAGIRARMVEEQSGYRRGHVVLRIDRRLQLQAECQLGYCGRKFATIGHLLRTAVANAQGKDDFNKVIFGIDAICTF